MKIMKRKIYQKLLEWKNSKDRKPLMLLGARQVGKSYIVEEFCKKEFSNYVIVNLFERTDIVKLYEEEINSSEKYMKLKLLINVDIEKEDT